jgi:type III secretion system FlhB-like substrate exporter
MMLDYESPDLVIAFGHGRGTDHLVACAKRRGIPVREIE